MGCTSLSFPACGRHDTCTYSWIQGVKAGHISIAPYNLLMLHCLHCGKTQPAWKPVQWVAAVLPMSCEKHPGRSGDNSGAVCIGGLQERGGSAGEPSWSTRRTQVDFGQKGWNKSDRYPALPLNLYRKGGNNFSLCLEIYLPSSPLATIHELGTSICRLLSLETREVGADWAWWASLFTHRQNTCTGKADSPDQQRSLSTGKHWNCISFFRSESLRKSTSRAVKGISVRWSNC